MTRETKIGLLVGLGFIVVFAVLLSHNGTGPSPVQTLPPPVVLASPPDNAQPASATLTPTPVSDPAEASGIPGADSQDGPGEWRDPLGGQLVLGGTGDDLPAPIDFDRTGIITAGTSDDTGSMGLADAGHTRGNDLGMTRVVPPVVAPIPPEPTLRPDGPSVTQTPENSGGSEFAGPGDTAPTGGSTHAVTAPAKPYLVHKGDNLVKITKQFYGKSTPDVISLVVDANKNTVKGRDSLREGQTILIPALPADLFEKTAGATGTPDMKAVERMINPGDRNGRDSDRKPAPTNVKPTRPVIPGVSPATTGTYVAANNTKPPTTDKPVAGTDAKKPAGVASAAGKADAAKGASAGKDPKKATAPLIKAGMRTYEIRPKDTFTSIAQRELGSTARVAEIKQLNKDIDPAKMKPGTKIKIPTRQPLSGDVSTRQLTA